MLVGNGLKKLTYIDRPWEREAIQAREVSTIQDPHLGIIVRSDNPHGATGVVINVDRVSDGIFIGGYFSTKGNPRLVQILHSQ